MEEKQSNNENKQTSDEEESEWNFVNIEGENGEPQGIHFFQNKIPSKYDTNTLQPLIPYNDKNNNSSIKARNSGNLKENRPSANVDDGNSDNKRCRCGVDSFFSIMPKCTIL